MKMKLSILLGLLVTVSFSCFAQDYDDIYYNSSKKKAKKTTVIVEQNENTVTDTNNGVSYVSQGVVRDVDEYNRRYSVLDTLAYDNSVSSENQGDFVYTDRIKRFHNPSVIIETNDPEIAEIYYVSTSPNVNLIVGTPSSYWNPYWYDWYFPSYSWHVGWYGPSWYNWGWNWSFGWGWDWCHPVYYPHHHHHYPSWGPIVPNHPGHGVKPPAGGHRPTYNAGGRRPNVNRSSGSNAGVGRRPAVTVGNRNNGTVSNDKNNNRRPSVNINSGTSENNKSSGRRPAVNKSNDDNKKQSRESYNNNSNSSRPNRNSSYSSGSGRSRNSFGGGNSGGGNRGGGSRGGRR